MSSLSILQVREGAHPLYVVYQNREKWGEDYSGEILVEHDKYLVITPEEKRFFFYYNNYTQFLNYRTWCKDRGGQKGYIYSQIAVFKDGIVLKNVPIVFETHLVYSGYRIVWSKNAFYLDKLKKNEHAFGSTIDSLCNVQIVSKLNESWSMHQADGNTNFVCSSTSGVFEIRYRICQVSKNLSNNLFHLEVTAHLPDCVSPVYKCVPIRVLSKPPSFCKIRKDLKAMLLDEADLCREAEEKLSKLQRKLDAVDNLASLILNNEVNANKMILSQEQVEVFDKLVDAFNFNVNKILREFSTL